MTHRLARLAFMSTLLSCTSTSAVDSSSNVLRPAATQPVANAQPQPATDALPRGLTREPAHAAAARLQPSGPQPQAAEAAHAQLAPQVAETARPQPGPRAAEGSRLQPGPRAAEGSRLQPGPRAAEGSQPAAAPAPSAAASSSRPLTPQPSAATPAAPVKRSVRVPETAHVKVDVPAPLQALLDDDPRMVPWLAESMAIIERCHAKDRSAAGTISIDLTLHLNERPTPDVGTVPAALRGVFSCAMAGFMQAERMPLFTGPEGQKHRLRVRFLP